MQVWSQGWEDPLEEEMATHSSSLAWKIPQPEEPGGIIKSCTQLSDLSCGTSLHMLSLPTLHVIHSLPINHMPTSLPHAHTPIPWYYFNLCQDYRKYIGVALFWHSPLFPGPRFYLLILFLVSFLIIDSLFSTEQWRDPLIRWIHPWWLRGMAKASACNAGDLGSIPGSWRSPGEGNGNPLQYSCLENPMDRGAWWVHRSQSVRHN